MVEQSLLSISDYNLIRSTSFLYQSLCFSVSKIDCIELTITAISILCNGALIITMEDCSRFATNRFLVGTRAKLDRPGLFIHTQMTQTNLTLIICSV